MLLHALPGGSTVCWAARALLGSGRKQSRVPSALGQDSKPSPLPLSPLTHKTNLRGCGWLCCPASHLVPFLGRWWLSPCALAPLCCTSRLAAAAWCEADVPCLVLCLASVHPAGICIPVLAGKVPWALWKRPRYPPRGRVSSRAENTWQRSAERKGMPFASSFSVLPGFSRFPERKNCIFFIFQSMPGSDVGVLFLSRLSNIEQE